MASALVTRPTLAPIHAAVTLRSRSSGSGLSVGFVALIAVYIAAWVASPLVTNTAMSDLDIFFWPAAQLAVHGHPFQIYALPGLGNYPDANGPLGLVPLIPAAGIANALGLANDLRIRAGLADGIVAICALLMARQGLHIVRMERGEITWRLATPLVFLAAPALWVGVADFGHIEQPLELLLVLLAVRFTMSRRPYATGICLGLAVLTRSTALLYVLPFLATELANRRVRATVQLGGAAALTAVVGIAPFIAANPGDAVHSLITYRAALRVAGGSLWIAFTHTSFEAFIKAGDTYIVIGLVLAACALVASRRPKVAASPSGLLGLLAVAAMLFPAFAKTSLPYYLMEAYVFAASWWLARPGNAWNWRLTVPLVITATVLMGKWAETIPAIGTPYVAEGITASVLLVIAVGLVVADLLGTRPSSRALVSDATERDELRHSTEPAVVTRAAVTVRR